MADAKAVTFKTETKASIAARVSKENPQPAEAAPAVAPEAGDRFTPERGKVGVWHRLSGEASNVVVAVVTH